MRQEFKAHTDYFELHGADYACYCSIAGNRTWTFMIYLNQPDAGGATRFTRAGKTIQPETGKLLVWDNGRPDGSYKPASIHHRMKVRSGMEAVIAKWDREREWGSHRQPAAGIEEGLLDDHPTALLHVL